MNILFLTDGITPYNTGGMQKHSFIMVKLLAQKKINITLVHCGYFNNPIFNENYLQIFTKEELQHITPIFVPFISKGKLPGHYLKESKYYSKLIFKKVNNKLANYDLIYAQGFTAWHFLNNTYKIPVYVNLHGFEMFQKAANLRMKLEHKLLKPTVKYLVKNATYVLSFGGRIDLILKNIGVSDSKIIQQANGIEKNWIIKTEPKNQPIKTYTFIGRYERRKGIEELTQALNILINSELKFKFIFIGPIPKSKQIINSKIIYTGEIKNSIKIKEYLDHSDFLISPSYSEGMPTVILEAMARGNSIITTNVGANTKMVDKSNGFIIDNSSTSIIETIHHTIKIDDSLLKELKKNSIKKVSDNFVWEKVIDNQIKIFKDNLNK